MTIIFMPITITDFSFWKCSNIYCSKTDIILGLIIILVLEATPLMRNDALWQE